MPLAIDFGRLRLSIRTLLILTIISSLVSARIDLFIEKSEMQRLMGVQGELWYMENGIVDRAAADYEMEIMPDVEEVYLWWTNRHSKPIPYSIVITSDPQVQSSMQPLSIPSIGAIEPSTTQSSDDEINAEIKPDVFSIRLPPCQSQSRVDFRMRLRFIFEWPSASNRTELELRRKKRCSAAKEAKVDQVEENLESSGDSMVENTKQKRSEVSAIANFLGSATNLFYVAMGCLFGMMLITASLIILYFAKADEGVTCCPNNGKVTKVRDEADDVGSSLLPPPPRTPIITSTPMDKQPAVLAFQRGCTSGDSVSSSSGVHEKRSHHSRRSASPSNLSKCTSAAGGANFAGSVQGNGIIQQQQQQPLSDTLPRVLHFNDDRRLDLDAVSMRLLLDKAKLELGRVLLEGTFGEICIGRAKIGQPIEGIEDEDDEHEWVDVVVKRMKEKASAQQIGRFLSESLRFSDLPPHVNVALPVALCKANDEAEGEEDKECQMPDPCTICYAHDGFGNLKKFLLRCRGADSTAGGPWPPPMVLSTQDLVYAALQMIRGLLHLHKFRLLHRDVAVRNCLVGHDLSIQICDTGLSRDLFPQDYHCLGDNENRPIKWLSFESLERSEFSTASDVWAFGVALWELTTLAQQPYTEVDPFEMQIHLQADQRLAQPYNCPDELYLLMYCCWNLHPEARPTFSQLLAALEHFYAQLTQYI